MAESYNPDDYTVDQVNEYLATADETERQRVLDAERDGQARKGILAADADAETTEPGNSEPTGLASTGNPNDLASGASTPESAPGHQDGAPADLVKVADDAAEKGYLGDGVEGKPDYSQANPSVMNQDG